ncbi:MAG: T9SS C-terminal target domain-containing protein [Bacteroidetes bacterium]|nr:MAG: T9SS C-terminal target domain-containing protein [Bacteroidota bacterium]
MKLLIPLLFLFLTGSIQAQNFDWKLLPEAPFHTCNNAVVEAFDGDHLCAYSFGGMDTSKIHSGIHQKAMKYDPITNSWSILANLPDSSGKIASAASVVRNKIYIIGGYHVAANGHETSSNKVHVFNPLTESFEADASPIPIPIDDHVQLVWRDSLIFVVSGWSNTQNVPNVQIFNPSLNQWTVGTSTSNNFLYTAFGASGVIIGDTIFYHGGARMGGNFPGTDYLRKGVINPVDPEKISWSQATASNGLIRYRAAAVTYGDRAFWMGGSEKTYNYDGVAYDGSGGVNPTTGILTYQSPSALWKEVPGQPYGVMDLRGIAQMSSNSWIIIGGMENGQQVSNKAYLITLDEGSLGLSDQYMERIEFFPNPVDSQLQISPLQEQSLSLFQANGKLLRKIEPGKKMIDVSDLAPGRYILQTGEGKSYSFIKK